LWINPLKESLLNWRNFISEFNRKLSTDLAHFVHEISHIIPHLSHYHSFHCGELSVEYGCQADTMNEILNSSVKRKKSANRKKLKLYLTEYLSQVNANILLSQIFETGFHDWYDYKPFYHEKFLSVAKESSPGEKEIENIKKLFEISFPEFSFWEPDNVLKALNDKRIQELRQLVDSACKGEVEFDREFANRTLLEVFKIETGMTKFRNIVSYLTMPLGFIPTIGTPIQKGTEEIITKSIEPKMKKGFQWFYMISELAHKPVNKE
jgi:hypothetical protein